VCGGDGGNPLLRLQAPARVVGLDWPGRLDMTTRPPTTVGPSRLNRANWGWQESLRARAYAQLVGSTATTGEYQDEARFQGVARPQAYALRSPPFLGGGLITGFGCGESIESLVVKRFASSAGAGTGTWLRPQEGTMLSE